MHAEQPPCDLMTKPAATISKIGAACAGASAFRGGGGMGIPMGRGGGIGLGGIALLLVLWLVFGINPLDVLNGGGGGGFTTPQDESPYQQVPGQQGGTAPSDGQKNCVSKILGTTERSWERISPPGERYTPPKLVLFTDQVRSQCGDAVAAIGPFYCPIDQKVYLDLAFYRRARRRLRRARRFRPGLCHRP